MKNTIIILAVLAMAVLNYTAWRKNGKLNKQIKQAAENLHHQEEQTAEISGAFYMTLKNAPFLTKLNLSCEITDTNNVTHLFSSLLNENPRLFYRVVPGGCDLCTDLVMEELGKRIKDPGFSNTVILLPDTNHRNLTIFKQKYSTSLEVFCLPPAALQTPLDSTRYSYLFTADRKTGMGNFFYPLYKLPDLATAYFSSLEKGMDTFMKKD